MRRLTFTLLFALFAAPAAFAAAGAVGDGALSIVNANVASIQIAGKGTIYGQLDKGTIAVTDTDLTDGTVLVTGGKRVASTKPSTVTYTGKDLTFRLVGGLYKFAISGTDVNFVAVGVGKAYLKGDPTADDAGSYTVDGAKLQPIPVAPTVVPAVGTTWPGLLVTFGKQAASASTFQPSS
jgi:hypothetical protein